MHCGLLFHVECVHGAHQNFERIARKRFLALVGVITGKKAPLRPSVAAISGGADYDESGGGK